MPIGLKRTGGALPIGIYRFVITKAEEKSGDKSDYINLQLNPFIKGQPSGKIVWSKVMMNENSRWRMEQFLNAVGAPDAETEEESIPVEWLQGKTFWAKVSRREYQGQIQNDLVQFYTDEQAEAAIEKFNQEQEEDARLSGAGTGKVSKKPKGTPVPELAGAGKGEDLPF